MPLLTSDFEAKGAVIRASDYKWLSADLQTAQSQYAVQPYTAVQVVDDQVVFDIKKYSTFTQRRAKKTPDDKVIAVGKYYKPAGFSYEVKTGIFIANSPEDSAFNTPVTYFDEDFYGMPAIEVSDWINGQYVVDVYYLIKSGGGTYEIWHRRSSDSGITFTPPETLIDTGMTTGPVPGGIITIPQFFTATPTISIAAGKPTLQSNNTISGSVFWLRYSHVGGFPGLDFYQVAYKLYNGSSWDSGSTYWSPKWVNTDEWYLDTLDVFTHDGVWDVYVAGRHQLIDATPAHNSIKSIYHSRAERLTSNILTDIWTPARDILTSVSPSETNLNSFTFPLVSFDGEYLWLTCKAQTVETVAETSDVVTKANYFLMQSKDFLNFSYPTAITTNAGEELIASSYGEDFISNANHYYTIGQSEMWRFIKQDIVADVTEDVVKLSITETAGAPSSLTLEIGNQDGKWAGETPTMPGYQALAKNKKVNIYLGYYVTDTIGEVAPRNTYYIDDIKQNTAANKNQLEITARDWYKKTRTTFTRFPYTFKGSEYYTDVFDGTNIGNWNQLSGSWIMERATGFPTIFEFHSTDGVVQVDDVNNIARIFQVDTNGTLTQGLISYWQLEEATATQRNDFFSNHHLTQAGGVTQVPGKIDYGAGFQASLFQYLYSSSPSFMDEPPTFSVSFWFKSSTPSFAGIMNKILTYNGVPGVGTAGYSIYKNDAGGGNKMCIILQDGTGKYLYKDAGSGYADNVMRHCAITWNGDRTDPNQIKIYINGVLTGGAALSSAPLGFMSNARPFEISGLQQAAPFYDFDGTLDEVSIWNKVLSQQEINDLYNSTKGQTMEYDLPAGASHNPGSDVLYTTLTNLVTKAEYSFAVKMQMPVALFYVTNPPETYRHSIVYAYWQDADNWLRWRFFAKNSNVINTYAVVELSVNGTVTTPVPESIITTGYQGQYAFVVIEQYAFTKYRFIFNRNGITGEAYTGQPVFDMDTSHVVNLISPAPKVVALGGAGHNASFRNFLFCQYDESMNVEELTTTIGSMAGIFDYKFDYLVDEKFFETSYWENHFWTGTYNAPYFLLDKRTLVLRTTEYHTLPMDKDGNASAVHYKQVEIGDGDVEFEAKITRVDNVDLTKSFGADVLFRTPGLSTSSGYGSPPPVSMGFAARIQNREPQSPGTRVITAQIRKRLGWYQERLLLSTSHEFWGVPSGGGKTIDPYHNPLASIFSNLNVDLTQWHKYRILMVGSWYSFFVDGQMVVSFYDWDNEFIEPGYFGFRALENSVLTIKNIKSRLLYPQVPAFGLNPGDDLDSSMISLEQIQRSWFMSDLLGRFKGTVLQSSDDSDYHYEGQLMTHGSDSSDKEFVDQVTVIGSNIQAVARDNSSIGKNVKTRDMVVVDYKITTLGEASKRAQNELNEANKFTVQSDMKQIINSGAEILDVVHVKDKGYNSTDTDTDLRVYNQTITIDGQNTTYTIDLGTGKIT